MDTYVFSFHAKPTKGSSEFGKVGGAYVDVFVKDKDRNIALSRAKEFVIEFAWDILSVETEIVLNDELVLQYREDVQAQYRRAQADGLCGFFCAYPVQDREDGIVEIRHVGDSTFKNTSKH